LRSHGLLTCGKSVAEMFLNMTLLQRSCEIQVIADATGKPLNAVSEEIGKKTTELLKIQMASAADGPVGQLEFDAMRRLVDREDDSYDDL
jgi:ribulose-5-phosphate 4-epimerase/fuculose-1-phosphate aldolase